jgi:basic amino acid/polyamine antiporter, APA family
MAAKLAHKLGAWDGALLTIGAVIGTGIFMTPGEMARALPHSGLLVLVWLLSGVVIVAGALTYAELGTLYPRAGGIYQFLHEAYGPLWAFLYGWTCFTVIMSGGVAAIAMGFGQYFVAFVPVPGGEQAAAVLAIIVLTTINSLGVKQGAWVQNLLTVIKVGSLAAFIVLGLSVPAGAVSSWSAPVPGPGLFAAFGVAMIAALWAYDGWYALTFSAGELEKPGKNLPRSMVLGMIGVVVVYTLVNVAYVRALPVEIIGTSSRVAESAATALFGTGAGKLMAMAIVVSAFGCLSATIFYSSRLYAPMAEAGLFFRALAVIHPRTLTPVRSLWAQSAWASALVLSGSYAQLYTYVTFAAVAFHVATGAAVFVLRQKRPELPRPYRTWGYPVVPLLFVLTTAALVLNTILESPKESLVGLGLMILGIPAYVYWRRSPASAPSSSVAGASP